MKKLLLLISFVWLHQLLWAQQKQNLVINGGFEELTNGHCVQTANVTATEFVGWGEFGVWSTLQDGSIVRGSSPDSYNFDTCGGHPQWNNHVPFNTHGFQYPSKGNGYIGFLFQRGREWPTGSFVQPLVPGKTYCAEMHVNIAETFSTHGTKNIQMMLHTDSVLLVRPWSLWGMDSLMNAYYDTIQPITFYSDFITDTLHWTKITTHFVADSAYRFFTIGNFKRTDYLDSIPLRPEFAGVPSNRFRTYLFLDDVLIYDCSDTIPPPEPQFDFEVKAYPNPARDWVVLEYSLPSAGKLRLHATDMFGRLVLPRTELQAEKGIHTHEIDGSTWAAGQYHLSVLYEANGRSEYRHFKLQLLR
ncbi:MAG: hypothetical protein ACK417_01695 [Bacteroidia bacterium]